MTAADAPAVGALARRIWNAHYPSIVSQAQIDYMLDDRYAEPSLRAQMAEGQQFLLAQDGQEIIGFLSVGPLNHITEPLLRGQDPTGDADWFLHKFYIAPAYHGKGVGTAMLNDLHSRMPGLRRLRLQVNRRNENSWQFYLKRGFRIVAEADFNIGSGFKMEDYVMEKQF